MKLLTILVDEEMLDMVKEPQTIDRIIDYAKKNEPTGGLRSGARHAIWWNVETLPPAGEIRTVKDAHDEFEVLADAIIRLRTERGRNA